MGREVEQVQLRLVATASRTFRCNVCGAENEPGPAGLAREAASCAVCHSSGRLRALAWLVSDELFGAPLTLADLPAIHSWAGLGMSDVEEFAAPLERKFTYTNTYYHKPPVFDVTKADLSMEAKFDFIVSSEVLEHVPHPVAGTFRTLYEMLKPNGVLFLTVPYSLDDTVEEHYPDLHDYSLAQLRDSWVLINRTRDGRLQTFDNLVFHGGPGSTLEMRIFNERALRQMLRNAGFETIRIAGEACPEFGIQLDDPWSLPIAARKGKRLMESGGLTEFSNAYLTVVDQLRVTKRDLIKHKADYQAHVEWANTKVAGLEREMAERVSWAQSIERDAQTHLTHIEQMQQAAAAAEAEIARLGAEFETRTQWALALQRENESLTARCTGFENDRWLRFGRSLRLTR